MDLEYLADIVFKVERNHRRRKSIAIVISHDKGVVVRAPVTASDVEIQKLILARQSWIHKTLQQLEVRYKKFQPRAWQEGETFSFLGKTYVLEIGPVPAKKGSCELLGETLFVRRSSRDQIQKLVESWYRQKAIEILTERTHYFAAQMQVQPTDIIVKAQRCRWGSCDRHDKIRYNWKIIMAPLELIDYLIVHELAHIKEKNHSAAFWQVVAAAMPDYKKRRTDLKHFHVE